MTAPKQKTNNASPRRRRPRRRRGELMLDVLSAVGTGAKPIGEIIASLLSIRYGGSISEVVRRNMESGRSPEQAERQRFYEAVYRLRRDGLLAKKKTRTGTALVRTKSGEEKYRALKRRLALRAPKAYAESASPAETFTIVAFDIPEKERHVRDWLRGVLRNLGGTMVQKSVWMGKVKIPRKLLDDLRAAGAMRYVEIFEITKKGTLRRIAD